MRLTRRRAVTGLVLGHLVAGAAGWLASRPATAQGPVVTAPPLPIPPAAGRQFSVLAPAGGFARDFHGGGRFAVRFDGDRLTAEATLGDAKHNPPAVWLEADWAMTRDGVIHGVVTAVELQPGSSGATLPAGLAGEPFALRVRQDGPVLTVSDVRVGGRRLADGPATGGTGPAALLRAVAGRYTATAEPVAAARKPALGTLPWRGLPPAPPAAVVPVMGLPSLPPAEAEPVMAVPPLPPPLLPPALPR